jgi:hypothetical protein
MRGDDDEDTALLLRMRHDAEAFLRSFEWYRGIKESYFGLGVGKVVAVFLYRIHAQTHVDEWHWIIVGDLPFAYLITDAAPNPIAALGVYCDLMQQWVDAVLQGSSLDTLYPVAAEATAENANLLQRRIEMLKTMIIPMFESEL